MSTTGAIRPAPPASSAQEAPSRRSRVRNATIGMLAAATATATIGAVALATLRNDPSTCPRGHRTLDVVASPDIAPVISEVARTAIAGGSASAADGCLTVSVRAEDPAITSVAITSATKAVAAKADSTSRRTSSAPTIPDVWVPDSSLWLQRTVVPYARSGGPSIALSPVVLSVPQSLARSLGWPAAPVAFGSVLGASLHGLPVPLRIPEPSGSAVATGSLIAVQRAVAGRPDAPTVLASALRNSGPTTLTSAVSAPASSGAIEAEAATSGSVVPRSEQSLWSALASSASRREVVAVYPTSGGTVLDYPYLALGDRAGSAESAGRLLDALRAPAGQEILRDAGFRDASGAAGRQLKEMPLLRGARRVVAQVPSADAVEHAVDALAAVNLGTRLLAVIDVSGSMAEPVPSAGGARRIDLVKKAAGNGLALYDDRAEIGLWTFSTDLTPTTDYRELVPIGPLGGRPGGHSGREMLARSIGGVAPVRGGSTGLYDTVLAAVRTVRAGWEPGRVNSVVVLTDGENDDPAGIGLARLLTTLKAEADPARPVLVIGIAYGPDSDQGALVAISAITGGTAYTAENPADVERVFLDATGRRSCRPEC